MPALQMSLIVALMDPWNSRPAQIGHTLPYLCVCYIMSTSQGLAAQLWNSYKSTPVKLKIIDLYLVYVLLTGIAQFSYRMLVGTFPYNSFLSGFISTVGCFVLTGMLFLAWPKKRCLLESKQSARL